MTDGSATLTGSTLPVLPAEGLPGDGADWTPPSWDDVVREHADRVYRLAYRLTGNQHDAEDLTQETFVRVFRSLASYKPGTFEGWLHRITTNLFLDMVRRRSRIRMEALPEDSDRLPGLGPEPEQVFSDTHLDPMLQAALDELPPEFRAAVVLCDVEGLSYEEIGATLGVKLGTVRSRIHRGRAALRGSLERRRLAALGESGGRSTARCWKGSRVADGRWRISVTPPDWGQDHLSPGGRRRLRRRGAASGPHARASQHLGQCPECAAQVSAQGQARKALRTAGGPCLPSTLLSSLRAIPLDAELPAAAARAGHDRRRPAGLGGAPGAVPPPAAFPGVPPTCARRPSAPRATRPARAGRRPAQRRLRVGTGVAVSGLALGALVFGASAAAPAPRPHRRRRPTADRGVPGGRRCSAARPSLLDARLQLGGPARRRPPGRRPLTRR